MAKIIITIEDKFGHVKCDSNPLFADLMKGFENGKQTAAESYAVICLMRLFDISRESRRGKLNIILPKKGKY